MDAFADTLHLTVRRSVRASVGCVLLHAFAAFVCALLAWRRPWLWPVLGIMGFSLCHGWRLICLESPASIIRLRWYADDRWWWQTRDGRCHLGECVAADVHGAALVVLTLRADGQRWRYRRCLIFADATDAATHRRLRARLRVTQPAGRAAARA